MQDHLLTFYPIGNADCTLVQLVNGQSILFDYANKRNPNDRGDKRIDLPTTLNKSVMGDYDVACFTHLDDDHICGFSNYFFLEHAAKYQGEGRKKMNDLWVPAAALLESNLTGEARILRSEARYRLKRGKEVKVFSRPKKMRDWCDQQEDISYESVKHLFINAGKLVPGFTRESEGIEFFVHSPFASKTQDINRNREAIVVQATFDDDNQTKLLLGSDIDFNVWTDIVKITKHFGNEMRLLWDIFHISHHCSYKSLSNVKDEDITIPTDEIEWLFETQGNDGGYIVSPSRPIPLKGTVQDEDSQPPHRQAANYYRQVAKKKKGEFKVTMEHPNVGRPEPMVFKIDRNTGLTLEKKVAASISFVTERKPPRAG